MRRRRPDFVRSFSYRFTDNTSTNRSSTFARWEREPTVSVDSSSVPVRRVQTMDGQSKDSLYLGRLTATLAGVFITLATLLSRFSLYGIVSYSVTQRTTEIGIAWHSEPIEPGGSNTVADCIRRPSPRDFRNSPMTGAPARRDCRKSAKSYQKASARKVRNNEISPRLPGVAVGRIHRVPQVRRVRP